MECDNCFPSQPLVVLTVDQFVGHDGGPLEQQNQDSHVYKKTGILPLIFVPSIETLMLEKPKKCQKFPTRFQKV